MTPTSEERKHTPEQILRDYLHLNEVDQNRAVDAMKEYASYATSTLTEQNAKLKEELHELNVKRFFEGGHSLGIECENVDLKEDNQKLKETIEVHKVNTSLWIQDNANLKEALSDLCKAIRSEHSQGEKPKRSVHLIMKLKNAESLLEESKPLNS